MIGREREERMTESHGGRKNRRWNRGDRKERSKRRVEALTLSRASFSNGPLAHSGTHFFFSSSSSSASSSVPESSPPSPSEESLQDIMRKEDEKGRKGQEKRRKEREGILGKKKRMVREGQKKSGNER